ncbi:MAG TPA: hypothetical protein VGQ93_00015 [Lysobacter sp.]|nr:hypothetical protein [Lysobacter sp.]
MIEAVQDAARIGPNSLLLNYLSASWFARGDPRRGMAYLSQTVRFSIGRSGYRAFRVQMNLFSRPEWAIVDLEYIVSRDPGSPHDRQLLAQAKENLRNGTAEKMARGEAVTFDEDGEFRKVTLLKECEEYGLSGKRSSDVMNKCSDSLVRE